MHQHRQLKSSELDRTAQGHLGSPARTAPLNRRSRTALIGAALLVGLAVVFPAGAASVGASPAAGSDRSGPQVAVAASADWVESTLAILRELIIILGGNPDELDERLAPEENMSVVVSRYYAVGAPRSLTSEERSSALNTIDTADSLSREAPDTVDSAAVAEFRAMLSEFRTDLTVTPVPQPPTPEGV